MRKFEVGNNTATGSLLLEMLRLFLIKIIQRLIWLSLATVPEANTRWKMKKPWSKSYFRFSVSILIAITVGANFLVLFRLSQSHGMRWLNLSRVWLGLV